MKDFLIYMASLMMLFFGGFLLGRNYKAEDVIERVRTDTLIVRDTIRYERPAASKSERIKDTIYALPIVVSDTVHDTVLVSLPIERKTYEHTDYKAVVSGIYPSLDYIEVHPITKTIEKRISPKWGVGIQSGYGIGGWYAGIGIQYNIFVW